MDFDDDALAALLEVMRWRRDIRHFRTDPVPEPCLERLADAMAMAPSVGNARPWRVVRVETPALRAAVRSHFEACNAEAELAQPEARRAAYRALKLAGLDTAPVQLAIFTETDPPEGHGLGRRTMPETLEQSTAMAIHALWLAARAMNLGVGMVSIVEPARLHALLGAAPSWRFSAYLCIGAPAFVDDTPLLHRVGWQPNREAAWVRR